MSQYIHIEMKIPLPEEPFARAEKMVEAKKLHGELMDAMKARQIDPNMPSVHPPLTIALAEGPVHIGRPTGARDRTPRKRRAAETVAAGVIGNTVLEGGIPRRRRAWRAPETVEEPFPPDPLCIAPNGQDPAP